jgi:asparagine synthase (glutamine-hydrolysing)
VCGQRHEIIPLGEEFLTRFGSYAERAVYLSDGCVDVSRAPDLYVNDYARDIAPIRMTGNYGGEVLRRVRAFRPRVRYPELWDGDFRQQLDAASVTYADAIRGHPLSFTLFRQTPWHHYGLLALEETRLAVRSPFLDNDFVKTVYRGPAAAFANNDVCTRLIGDGDPRLRAIATDRGYGGGRLLATLLELEFKAEYAYDYGMPQWMAKADRLVSRLHPERVFLGRHKFYHFRVWYRDALARYVRAMLLDRRSLARPYLNAGRVRAMVEAHLSGRANYTSEIHKMLTLELVHRAFIDGG